MKDALLVTALIAALIGTGAPSAVHAAGTADAGARRSVVLAGGCFWGMEAVFAALKGVSSAVPGYAGGSRATAHYEIVSTGMTGHAESVEIVYDPAQISFRRILDVFFTVAHDPTQRDRQGPDVGSQYRSAIFYRTDEQRREAEAYVRGLEAAKTFSVPIATVIVPLPAFYPAEAYHRHYVARNPNDPYVAFNDLPKLQHLRERYPDLVKTAPT